MCTVPRKTSLNPRKLRGLQCRTYRFVDRVEICCLRDMRVYWLQSVMKVPIQYCDAFAVQQQQNVNNQGVESTDQCGICQVTQLTLSETAKFRIFQIERICRRQF